MTKEPHYSLFKDRVVLTIHRFLRIPSHIEYSQLKQMQIKKQMYTSIFVEKRIIRIC